MWIVNVALRRPYTFIVAALLVLLAAPWVLRSMPSDIFPRIDIPVVAILWQYNGLSAREIADRLVSPSERGLMQQVSDIEHIESQSLAGLGVIKVFFHPGTDIRSAVSHVLSSSSAALRGMPTGTQPPQIYEYSATDLPILQLGISSRTVPDNELADLAMNTVRGRLATIPGVALNYPYGTKGRQVSVDLDTSALLARGLTPSDVTDAIGNGNLILPTGEIKLGANSYPVALNGAVPAISMIGDIPIRTVNGNTTYVRDVAFVRDGYSPQTTIVRQNGERGVLLTVLKNGRASTVELVDKVRAALPVLLARMPEGIAIEPMFDQSLFVDAAITNVVHEGVIAAALTSALILLFLGSWRSTCIIAVSIPLSILCSILTLHLLGHTLNLMTLGGLALAVGILVDDATVEIENIERQLALGKHPEQAILDGAAQIAAPAFVSTLSICIVFVPLFSLTGIAGSLFVPLAEAVIFAMIASYVLSRTLVPTLVLLMGNSHGSALPGPFERLHGRFNAGFASFRERYSIVLDAALRRPRRIALGFVLACAVSLALTPLLGQDFFPEVDAGQLRLHVRATPGTRLEEMPELIDRIERVIRETIAPEDVENILDIVGGPYSARNTVFGNSGTADSSDSEIMISLRGTSGTPTRVYRDALRAELPRRFPGIEFFFQPADQVSQSLNFGTPAPIDIQISGNDSAANLKLAAEINSGLRSLVGVVDAHVYQRYNKPSLNLQMDRSQLEQLGLKARDVAQDLLITLSGSGQTLPSYWLNPLNGNTYNVGVQVRETQLDSLDALLRTPVSSGNGGKPQLLGNLVSISRSTQPAAVSRYDMDNVINIYASVSGRDLGSVGRDIEQLVEQYRSKLSRGADITVRGQYQTMRSSYRGLTIGLGVAIVLVYFLIVVNFQSWLDPLLIVAALPAALAGIVWMLYLTGTPLSVPALTGTIMTMGVATANSILVISFARERLQLGDTPVAAALSAGATRLRPVLMTALAMIVGMLPMACGFGQGGEQNAPLGRTVIGGLLFATVSTLLVVPTAFAALHQNLRARRALVRIAPSLPETQST